MITLLPDEHIVLERRRYWLPIALEGASLFALGVVPFLGIFFLDLLPVSISRYVVFSQVPLLFFASAWLLLVWIVFAVTWTNYYLHVLLITEHRLIYIEQMGLFARNLVEMRMENVQDIKVEVVGILPSLLGFGNMYIQTAAEVREFKIKNIPDPHTVKDLISRLHHDAAPPAAPVSDQAKV